MAATKDRAKIEGAIRLDSGDPRGGSRLRAGRNNEPQSHVFSFRVSGVAWQRFEGLARSAGVPPATLLSRIVEEKVRLTKEETAEIAQKKGLDSFDRQVRRFVNYLADALDPEDFLALKVSEVREVMHAKLWDLMIGIENLDEAVAEIVGKAYKRSLDAYPGYGAVEPAEKKAIAERWGEHMAQALAAGSKAD